uniref:Uncharacterized protein n=1 Tax=Nitrosopumivirus cobalaminus TaxID=3158414 RepID=A0AAU7N458_9VIRU
MKIKCLKCGNFRDDRDMKINITCKDKCGK